jgi:S1-C subfamily serine protease
MGNSQSTATNGTPLPTTNDNRESARERISGEKLGFQILSLVPNSPTSKAGLVPYFDYIIAVNDVRVTSELPNLVVQEAKNGIDKALKLGVYNARRDELRDVTVIPTHSWGGEGILGRASEMNELLLYSQDSASDIHILIMPLI